MLTYDYENITYGILIKQHCEDAWWKFYAGCYLGWTEILQQDIRASIVNRVLPICESHSKGGGAVPQKKILKKENKESVSVQNQFLFPTYFWLDFVIWLIFYVKTSEGVFFLSQWHISTKGQQ